MFGDQKFACNGTSDAVVHLQWYRQILQFWVSMWRKRLLPGGRETARQVVLPCSAARLIS
jgi:hypothetical protein